jgi:hypothetical protein
MCKRLIVTAACLVLAASGARAAVPTELTVQGVLRDANGMLQSMPVTVTIDLFDDQAAGNKLNAAAYVTNNVPVVNGMFTQTVTLSAPDLTAMTNAAQVWMAVQIGSDSFPRQKVTPELYALISRVAESANALSSSCSGCVTNANLGSGIDGNKVTTGTVAAAATAAQIQGRPVFNTAPANGQALAWNNTAMRWEPANVVTSIASGTGLTGGPITGTGTLALANTIPGDRTFQGIVTMGPSAAANNLAKLVVSDAVGTTSGLFGILRPISLVHNSSSVGFNAFENGGWKGVTVASPTGTISLDSGGDFAIHSGSAPAATGGAVSMVQRFALRNEGLLEVDYANGNDGLFSNGAPSGAGLAFGNGSGEGIASRRTTGVGQFGLDVYTNRTSRIFVSNSGQVGIGTRTPNTALAVRQDANGALGPVISLQNFGTGGGGAGAAIEMSGYNIGANPPTVRIQSLDDGLSSSHLAFYAKVQGSATNALAERMRIYSNGHVEIDRNDSNTGQNINNGSSGGAGLTFGNNSGEGISSKRSGAGGGLNGLDFYTSRQRRMFMDNGGGIYRTSNVGTFDQTSDERLKDIAGPWLRGLKEVLAIEPIRFKYKRGNPLGIEAQAEHIGVSAQALQRAIPEAVRRGEQGYLSITLDQVVWSMVNAIKDQNRQVTQLQAQNAELRARLTKLEGAMQTILAAHDAHSPKQIARR